MPVNVSVPTLHRLQHELTHVISADILTHYLQNKP